MERMTKKFIVYGWDGHFIAYTFYMLDWGTLSITHLLDENKKFLAVTHTRRQTKRIGESSEECFNRIIASRQKYHGFDDSHLVFHGMREFLT